MPALAGQAFNIGGGPANAISLVELLERLERRLGRPIAVGRGAWRTGDQRWYISDTRKFSAATGWRPTVTVETGLARLCDWIGLAAPSSEPMRAAS